MLGENIKVHFAGTEQIDFGLIAYEAGVKYFLFTCFPFISRQFGIKGFPITCKTMFPPEVLQSVGKHVIMDSGLFTLMFGAHAGQRDKKFIYAWQDALVQFVLDNNIKATCVEVDCQKVLGVEEAWQLRRRLKEQLPNNRNINVFHYEDGRKGFDRLIEFSEYIAISVPELRIVRPRTYKNEVIQLARYAKHKKPTIDIHLLGCTETGILERTRFCTTSDSTSWQSVNRYGRIGKYHVSQIKESEKAKAHHVVKKVLDKCGIEITPKRLDYYSNYYLSAKVCKSMYTKACGSQE